MNLAMTESRIPFRLNISECKVKIRVSLKKGRIQVSDPTSTYEKHALSKAVQK